jgi:hypothetical protein
MTDDTVTAKLAEWEALVEGATPGVWFPVDENGGAPGTPPAWTVSRTAATGDYAGDVVYLPAPLTDRSMDGQYAADAEFIAAARHMVPALLGFVREVLEGHEREVIATYEGHGEEAWCPRCRHHWPCPPEQAARKWIGGA